MAEEQNTDMPQFGPNGLMTAAVSLHELYTSYKDAGFSRDQAFKLVVTVLAEGVRASNGTQR